jgi:hypothetical protein
MEVTVFWVMPWCSPAGIHQSFRATVCHHLQVDYPEDGGSRFLRNKDKDMKAGGSSDAL